MGLGRRKGKRRSLSGKRTKKSAGKGHAFQHAQNQVKMRRHKHEAAGTSPSPSADEAAYKERSQHRYDFLMEHQL